MTAALVGRRRLLPPLVLGVLVWGAAFVLLRPGRRSAARCCCSPSPAPAGSLFDVAGRTILQRTAPGDVLSRVFGVLEGLSMAASRSARC